MKINQYVSSRAKAKGLANVEQKEIPNSKKTKATNRQKPKRRKR